MPTYRSVFVPLRDGVRLSTDVYLPAVDWPVPCVLVRTPYDKNIFRPGNRVYAIARGWSADSSRGFQRLVQAGFGVVIQDLRGRCESEGHFVPYSSVDAGDGYDTVTWLAEQPWCDGAIGTYGCSYLGETQAMLAAQRHPNHRAAVIGAAGGALGDDHTTGYGFMRGGAWELQAMLGWHGSHGATYQYGPPAGIDREAWFAEAYAQNYATGARRLTPEELEIGLHHLPLEQASSAAGSPPNSMSEWVTHDWGDPWWQHQGYVTSEDSFAVPALHYVSWYDIVCRETLRLFELFRNRSVDGYGDDQWLVVGPGRHCHFDLDPLGTSRIGEHEIAGLDFDWWELVARWFGRWLRGEDVLADEPRYRWYVVGSDHWESADTWPSPATPRILHLGSTGPANTASGGGVLKAEPPTDGHIDRFVYDPGDPVRADGGVMGAEGPYEQSASQSRDDVLVYTGEALESSLTIVGDVDLSLCISSSALDTDFTAKLLDVWPDGRAFNVVEGVLRCRYREGYDAPRLLDPGEVARIALAVGATAYTFGRGHRLRLLVSSSNFPRWDRNLNTGGDQHGESDWVVAANAVHLGPGLTNALSFRAQAC